MNNVCVRTWCTVPNIVTLVRVLLTPVIVYTLVHECWFAAAVCVALASLTDFFDGFLARVLQQRTALGALLDACADKVFMLTLVGTFWWLEIPELPRWICIFLLSKEIIIFLGSSWLYVRGAVVTIAPVLLGKISMALQMIMVIWLCATHAGLVQFFTPLVWCVLLCAVLVLGAYVLFFVRVRVLMLGVLCMVPLHAAHKKESRAHVQESIVCCTRDVLKKSVQVLKQYAGDLRMGVVTDDKQIVLVGVAEMQELLLDVVQELVEGTGAADRWARARREELVKARDYLQELAQQMSVKQKGSWWKTACTGVRTIVP